MPRFAERRLTWKGFREVDLCVEEPHHRAIARATRHHLVVQGVTWRAGRGHPQSVPNGVSVAHGVRRLARRRDREECAFERSETVYTTWDDVPGDDLSDLDVRAAGHGVSLRPALSAWWMPHRHRRPPRQALQPGQWLKWSINFRLGLDSGWRYGLMTLNVACGPEVKPDAFLGSPTKVIDELERLR